MLLGNLCGKRGWREPMRMSARGTLRPVALRPGLIAAPGINGQDRRDCEWLEGDTDQKRLGQRYPAQFAAAQQLRGPRMAAIASLALVTPAL
jgi:hypothetical protein